jgi:UDP-apiose/xylose synthase
MKICVLGCGGFIGSHLVERLLSCPGHRVWGIDTAPAKIAHLLSDKRFEFTCADIYHDIELLQRRIGDADVVVSLAALCNPSLYNTVPLDVIESNFTRPSAVVRLCSEAGTWLVHFSTCEVYGRTIGSYSGSREPEAFVEDTTPMVMGPVHAQRWSYACAKQLLERLIYAHGRERSLAYTIVRPFNFVGPRMDYVPGIDGEGVPRVVACFMDSLMFGKPLQLVDGGRSRRSFVYIDDAVDAILAILDRPANAQGEVFNIGNPDNEVSIAELARRMADLYCEISPDTRPEDIQIRSVEARDFYGEGYEDCDRRIPDITKATALLGWRPQVALDEALRLTIDAYREQYLPAAASGDNVA